MVNVYLISENVAVTSMLLFMVIVAGLVVPFRLPLQPVNAQPEAGVAVNGILDPEAYVRVPAAGVVEP